MKKIAYKKTNNGSMFFEIAGYIFCIHPDYPVPVSALNDDTMVFDPDCIISVDEGCLIIAQ